MIWRDKYDWPVELIKNRPVTNAIRILIHGNLWHTFSKWAEYRRLYYDLLYSVVSKYPNESRHDTAKRLIRNHESYFSNPQKETKAQGLSPDSVTPARK